MGVQIAQIAVAWSFHPKIAEIGLLPNRIPNEVWVFLISIDDQYNHSTCEIFWQLLVTSKDYRKVTGSQSYTCATESSGRSQHSEKQGHSRRLWAGDMFHGGSGFSLRRVHPLRPQPSITGITPNPMAFQRARRPRDIESMWSCSGEECCKMGSKKTLNTS